MFTARSARALNELLLCVFFFILMIWTNCCVMSVHASFHRWLWTQGADPLVQSDTGSNILMEAVKAGHLDQVRVILSHAKSMSSAMVSSSSSSSSSIPSLLLHTPDRHGRVPLHVAITMQDIPLVRCTSVRLPIEKTTHFVARFPACPLHTTYLLFSLIMILLEAQIRLLLEFGADVNACFTVTTSLPSSSSTAPLSISESTLPILLAAETGNLQMITLLLEAGAQWDGWEVRLCVTLKLHRFREKNLCPEMWYRTQNNFTFVCVFAGSLDFQLPAGIRVHECRV
jgi:hypothetical protein